MRIFIVPFNRNITNGVADVLGEYRKNEHNIKFFIAPKVTK